MPLFKKAVVNGRPVVQLSDVHLRVLRRCRMILIKDLDPVDILDSLTPEDGFKQDTKDFVLSLWSPEKQVGAILDHLETQSDETFGVFMDILREQYKHLHCVLVETARTLDETEDDQKRERAAIVGDSVRKLLRQTARRQLQDQSRRASSESPGDYYVDNLRNDGDDVGQYIDCYIIPTRGKLQKEKWIKHVTTVLEPKAAAMDTVAGQPRSASEIIITKDVEFKLIMRSAIPEGVAQPPATCTCIYIVKREEKNDNKALKLDACQPLKDSATEGELTEKHKDKKIGRRDRNGNCPPPLPPKPDMQSLANKNFFKNPPTLSSGPKQNSVEEKAVSQSPDVRLSSVPPLPIRKPQVKSEKVNHARNADKEGKLPRTPSSSGPVPQGNGTVGTDDDNDDEDALSLNYDVGLEEEDDPYERVSPNGQHTQGTRTGSVGSPDTRGRSRESRMSPSSPKLDSAISIDSTVTVTPVSDDTLGNGRRNIWPEPKRRLDSIGLDQSIPVDIQSAIECSHYEEIEPRGGSLSSVSGLYLDPRSDGGSLLGRRGTRQREHRNGTLLTSAANRLKNFETPSEVKLEEGTLLIIKHKDEIVSDDPSFGKTFLSYDHMGFAYYVPSDVTKRYGDPRSEKWFYPIEMSAREATLFLGSVNQKGCFVVYQPAKRSESLPLYCLSVSLGSGDVLHYNIVENIHGDVMIQDHDHSFMNVCDLVEYFRKNQSNLATRLRRSLKEANLPIMPSYHYDSRFEMARHEIRLSSIVVDKGTFGDHHLAAFKGISVEVCVMKTESSPTNDDDFLEEAQMMMLTEHENIIRFLGVSCRARPFYIVMEHIDRGTLTECLRNNVIPSDNIDSLFDICIQLVAAMYYLEGLHFMLHRNLATKSFFVTADFLVKLGKFERARHVVDDNYQASLSEEVMVRWAAPEVLISSTYSTKSDVWSLGVVFWEVFSQGACPYSSLGVEQVAVYVSEGGKLDKPPGCALDLWSMMKSCWKPSPNDRPTFAMLQDKIKGKSSIYYVSPVRSHVTNRNVSAPSELVRSNGSVPAKLKSPTSARLTGPASKAAYEVNKSSKSAPTSGRKKRSKSATRGLQERIINLDEREVREKRANSAVRNSCERARTPSSDSSSLMSMSIVNGSCDELDRGQKIRNSIKKFLK